MSLLQDNTPHELKYVQDLTNEFTNYISQLILNVYNGVIDNLDIPAKERYVILPPNALNKAFLNTISNWGKRLFGLIGRKIEQSPYAKFKIKGMKLYKDGKPLTNSEWNKFEDQIMKYMQPYVTNLSEEMAVKGILMGLSSMEMESQGKGVIQYGKKSYNQIENDRFKGYIPDSIKSVEDRYKIDKEVKKAINLAYVKTADFVTKVTDDMRSAIKSQVINAHRTGKSKKELASDLYWQDKDKPELKDKTSERLIRNWQRVASYEIASLHETGKMAAMEGQARESIDDPDKAVYVVFNGAATCDWCSPRVGTIARVIPSELIGNEEDDSLSNRGIEDEVTDIAVWAGKNNIARPKEKWRICWPSHPHCSCSGSRIHPEVQEFDKKSRRIKYKPKDKKLIEKIIPQDFMEELESIRAENVRNAELQQKEWAESLVKKDSRMSDEEYKKWRSELRAKQEEAERILEESKRGK